MNSPLVTIVVPILNRTYYLNELLNSLINQSYNNLEIIISDNGSINKIEQFIEPYKYKDERLIFRKNESTISMADHFNQCLNLAKGKYFIVISDDDIISLNYIQLMVEGFENNPNLSFGISNTVIIDKDSNERNSFKGEGWMFKNGIEAIKEFILEKKSFPIPTFISLFTITEKFKNIGGFPDFEKGGYSDTSAAINLLLIGDCFFEVNATFFYRVYNESYGLSMNHHSLAICGVQFVNYYNRQPSVLFDNLGLNKKEFIIALKKMTFVCLYNRLIFLYKLSKIQIFFMLTKYPLYYIEALIYFKMGVVNPFKKNLKKLYYNT